MDQVLLSYIEWGNEHYLLFGWTSFWGVLMLIAGVFQTTRLILFTLPNRILRTINVTKHGWPPEHLDADGDWRPATEED